MGPCHQFKIARFDVKCDACYCPQRVLYLSDSLSSCLILPRDFTPPTTPLSLSLLLLLVRFFSLHPSLPFSLAPFLCISVSLSHTYFVSCARAVSLLLPLSPLRARALSLCLLFLSHERYVYVCVSFLLSLCTLSFCLPVSRVQSRTQSHSLYL